MYDLNYINIIPATRSHLKKLLVIESSAFTPDDQYDIDDFIQLLKLYSNHIHIIKYKNKIIGYFVSYKEFNYYYLHSIAILPLYKKNNIASHILTHFRIPHAVLLNCTKIKLHVNVHNIPCIALYTKHGFSITKKINNYYISGEPAFIMEYQLPRTTIKES